MDRFLKREHDSSLPARAPAVLASYAFLEYVQSFRLGLHPFALGILLNLKCASNTTKINKETELNPRNIVFVLLLSLALISCGGGGGGNTSIPVTPDSSIDSISITSDSPGNPVLTPNATRQFGFNVRYSSGSIVGMWNAGTWASSAPDIATIDQVGLATSGTKDGITSITATYHGHSASAILSVKTPSSLTISGSNTTAPANSSAISLDARLGFPDGSSQAVSSKAVWTSSNTNVGVIWNKSGVKPVAEGTTTITVSEAGQSGSIDITVTPPATPTSIAINGLNSPSGLYNKRTQMQLSATVGMSAGASIAATSPVWSSSDSTVFTISSSGHLAGVGPGTATVTVSANGLTTSQNITMVDSASSPAVVVSCSAAAPMTISAATWNAYYAADPTNLTEWAVVDATTCSAFPFVVLVITATPATTQYSILLAPRYSATIFGPAITSNSTLTPQLSPGATVTVGYKPISNSYYYAPIYSFTTN